MKYSGIHNVLFHAAMSEVTKAKQSRPKADTMPGKANNLEKAVLKPTTNLLEKVEVTVKTYPDLQPFLEMNILILEGVYEHMAEVSRSNSASPN